jgi:hypothetical protein
MNLAEDRRHDVFTTRILQMRKAQLPFELCKQFFCLEGRLGTLFSMEIKGRKEEALIIRLWYDITIFNAKLEENKFR